MSRAAAKQYLVARPRRRPADRELAWKVVDKMWRRVDIYHGASELRQGLARATAGQVAVYATLFSDSEICNGGFHQFFWNPTGILHREAVAGFERIGAKRYAKLLVTAGALLGKTVPRDREVRIKRLERLPYESWKNRFWSIEERYYKLRGGKQALEHYAARFIDKHPAEFFVDA